MLQTGYGKNYSNKDIVEILKGYDAQLNYSKYSSKQDKYDDVITQLQDGKIV